MKLIKKLNDFNELVMFKHSFFSTFIFIAMVVSAHQMVGLVLNFCFGNLAA